MKATESELSMLHSAVTKNLRERIESGEASASDIGNAIKMLKDNNITCDPGGDAPLAGLAAALASSSAVRKADATDLTVALEQLEFDNTRSN